MANKKDYYVNISEPVFIKRTILESSRSVIHILQDNERLIDLREQKHELFQKFDKVAKEINSLTQKLKNDLPHVPVSKKSKPVKHKKEEPIKVQKVIPKERSALEALEQELRSVEEQLNKLSINK